jgi:hypothetical protein
MCCLNISHFFPSLCEDKPAVIAEWPRVSDLMQGLTHPAQGEPGVRRGELKRRSPGSRSGVGSVRILHILATEETSLVTDARFYEST